MAPVGTTTTMATSIPVRKGKGVVIYSQPLDGLNRGEQLAATASMTSDVKHLSYSPLVRSRLILALEPTARDELLDSVAHIAETDFGGQVTKPLVTALYTARKPH